MDSQLSVAIFMAPRTHPGAQECSIYKKKSKNYETHEHLPAGLVYAAISRNLLKSIREFHGFSNF